MVDGDGLVPFPVVFFDGERDINIGSVRIHPSLRFKNFQSVLSQMIGIYPNQISTYLIDRKKSKSEHRRRVPITGKANFSAISREKECSVLVVLKRSRRDRRVKPKQNTFEFSDYLSPENLILLRRNKPDSNDSQVSDYLLPYNNQIVKSEFDNFSETMHNLQIQRCDYLKSNSNFVDFEVFPKIEETYMITNCDECTKAKRNGRTASFHWCIYDAVTVGFRSPAGPIARPAVKATP